MAKKYDETLKDLPIILPPQPKECCTHAWHIYPIQLLPECGIERDEFILKMSEKNIGCSVHFIPLHKHPIWKESGNLKAKDFPVAESVYHRVVSIPLFTKMTDADQDRVIDAIREILA